MPITIRELVIRTIITAPAEQTGGQAAEISGEPADIDAIVQECVTQVMERLHEQNER